MEPTEVNADLTGEGDANYDSWSARELRMAAAIMGIDSPPFRPAAEGEWGHLPAEPCRFCHTQGGVFFLRDDGPEGISGLPIVRCSACRRSWTADSALA